MAGAETTTLDLSQPYLDWAKRNFTHNSLDPAAHHFCKGDTFHWLRRFAKQGRTFDGIVLDPPTFSRDEKGRVFRVEKDFGELAALASDILEPDGWLLCSTNCRNLGLNDFQKQLRPLVKAMCQLEDRPEDISRVQAFIFEEILGLDSALKQSVESTLVADFEKLKKDGLISSLRPKEKAEAWLAQRQAASMAMEQHLRALLPPEMLEHPMFESGEGLLLDLTTDELTFLNDDAKATPPPAATKP
jgi:hypothetical protein